MLGSGRISLDHLGMRHWPFILVGGKDLIPAQSVEVLSGVLPRIAGNPRILFISRPIQGEGNQVRLKTDHRPLDYGLRTVLSALRYGPRPRVMR